MPKIAKFTGAWLILLLLIAFLVGCSGGGGGSAKSGAVVDPASSFKGVATEAVVTEGNSEALAMGGFGYSSIATAIRSVSKTSSNIGLEPARSSSILQLVQLLKQSVRQMEIPQKAAVLSKRSPHAVVAKQTARESNYQIHGDSGGTATYTLEVNDATGSFFGTVVYEGFTSKGLVADGTTEVLGTMDPNRQQISRLTLSFRSLRLQFGDSTVSLTGSLSWGINLVSSTETLFMNVVLLDQASGKTFWFNNYEQTTAYGESSITLTISGRYYDHDHGYVDLTTQAPLVAGNGDEWPSQGALRFSGSNGRWVRLNFQRRTLAVEADFDGNDEVNWRTERPTNLQSKTNSAPIAEAGPDRSVKQWAWVQLDGSASSDPDGDPLSYTWTVVTSPGYNYTALTGANTAKPSFIAKQSGTYQLSLKVYDGYSISQVDTVTVMVAPRTPSDPSLVEQQWQFGVYGEHIGEGGLLAGDLDGDGQPEIVACASVTSGYGTNNVWYVVRRTASGEYEQIWRSPIHGVTIVRLLLSDMNGDGRDDVVVALEDGTINIYDGPTLKETRMITVTAPLRDVAVADLDGDGTKEMVTSDGMGISTYNTQTGGLKWKVTSGGGNSIAVGNVDYESAPEIVSTSYGGKGYVLDGATGAIEWEYANSFGDTVMLGDLDGNGIQKIVAVFPWSKITILDASLRSQAWEIATPQYTGAVVVADADGDGVPEIVYGDRERSNVHAVDGQSRAERWTVGTPDSGVSGIALGDVDNDGKKEVIWGSGAASTAPDFLNVADPTTGAVKWKSQSVRGLSQLAVGDVDDDGEDEIVMVTDYSNSGYDGGIIHIFSARTHALKHSEKLGTRDWMGSHRGVRVGDVDDDGRTEFVIGSSDLYNGFIRVYDGATRSVKQQSAGYNGNYFSTLAIGDVDGDGKTEIVAGQGVEHSGAIGSYIIVFDGGTLQEKWRSNDFMSIWAAVYDIKVADLDRDGHPEIIASLANRRLIVIDGVTHNQKLMLDTPARALEVADVDGDGFLDLLVGRDDGNIDVYDGATLTVRKTVSSMGSGPVDAIKVQTIVGSVEQWIVASDGVLSILDAQDLKWRSTHLGPSLGRNNSIAVKDVDGDGRKSIFIGTDPVLYQFE